MKNIIPEKEIIFEDPEKFLSWGDNQTGIAVLCDESHKIRAGVCFLYLDRTEVGLLPFKEFRRLFGKLPKSERQYEYIAKSWKKRGWKLINFDYKTWVAKGVAAGSLYFRKNMKEKSFATKFYMEDGDVLEHANGKESIFFEPFEFPYLENHSFAYANLIEYLGKTIEEGGILIKKLIDVVIDDLLKKEPTTGLDSCVMFVREELIPSSERGRIGVLGYQLYNAFGLKKNKGEEL